jgi:carbamate kinase
MENHPFHGTTVIDGSSDEKNDMVFLNDADRCYRRLVPSSTKNRIVSKFDEIISFSATPCVSDAAD